MSRLDYADAVCDEAYERAAKLLEDGLIREPADEAEEHVNYVLQLMAAEVRALKSD